MEKANFLVVLIASIIFFISNGYGQNNDLTDLIDDLDRSSSHNLKELKTVNIYVSSLDKLLTANGLKKELIQTEAEIRLRKLEFIVKSHLILYPFGLMVQKLIVIEFGTNWKLNYTNLQD